MLRPVHKIARLDGHAARHGAHRLRMGRRRSAESPEGGPVFIVKGDGCGDLPVGDGFPGNLLQPFQHPAEALPGEFLPSRRLPVLGPGHVDHRHGPHPVFPVGAEAFEGIAAEGRHEGAEALQLPPQPHFQHGVQEGAGEGGEVPPGKGGLHLRPPEAEGQHPAGVHQLLRAEVGQHAHGLLPLGQGCVQLRSGVLADALQLRQQLFHIRHPGPPPSAAP